MKNCMLPIDFCIPDAEAHVMSDGKVYLYGSLDCAADRWCSDSYRVVSSSNLKEWKVSKPCFSVKDVPWAGKTDMRRQLHLDEVKSIDDLPENIRMFLPKAARLVPIKLLVNQIAKQLNADAQQNLALFAPDCICKNGRYYLYFCMSDNTEGVAVADQPEGPFVNAAQLPVTGIDPAVFVDDDGTAYYYWGQFNSHGARLTPDMMHIEEGSIVDNLLTEQEHHFHEGSSMRKRNGIYYYVFADTSRGKPTCLVMLLQNRRWGRSPIKELLWTTAISTRKAGTTTAVLKKSMDNGMCSSTSALQKNISAKPVCCPSNLMKMG